MDGGKGSERDSVRENSMPVFALTFGLAPWANASLPRLKNPPPTQRFGATGRRIRKIQGL